MSGIDDDEGDDACCCRAVIRDKLPPYPPADAACDTDSACATSSDCRREVKNSVHASRLTRCRTHVTWNPVRRSTALTFASDADVAESDAASEKDACISAAAALVDSAFAANGAVVVAVKWVGSSVVVAAVVVGVLVDGNGEPALETAVARGNETDCAIVTADAVSSRNDDSRSKRGLVRASVKGAVSDSTLRGAGGAAAPVAVGRTSSVL